MPLSQGKSKKAFEHNIKAEVEAGKPMKQALGIAYSVKRKNQRKKMAQGGMAYKNDSAKTESRPMSEERDNDSAMVSRNSGNKAASQDSWSSRPDIAQSQRGPKTTAIKHPKMVKSNILQVRLRDEEDHLQDSAGVNDGPQEQPRKVMDEVGANRQGPSSKDLSLKMMALGGEVDHGIEEREREDEAHLMDSASPSEDEGAADARSRNEISPNRQGPAVSDMEREHSNGRRPYAQGGMIHDEEEMEHEDSIAAAIMAKKERESRLDSDSDMDRMVMMAEGGEIHSHNSIYSDDSSQVDLSRNADEDANEEDQLSFNALRKENYSESEGLSQLDSPMDSNEHGDEIDSDDHDRVSRIQSKMNARRQFKQR